MKRNIGRDILLPGLSQWTQVVVYQKHPKSKTNVIITVTKINNKGDQQHISELKIEQTELQPRNVSNLREGKTHVTNDIRGDSTVGFGCNVNG